jgi:hypothetical protein
MWLSLYFHFSSWLSQEILSKNKILASQLAHFQTVLNNVQNSTYSSLALITTLIENVGIHSNGRTNNCRHTYGRTTYNRPVSLEVPYKFPWVVGGVVVGWWWGSGWYFVTPELRLSWAVTINNVGTINIFTAVLEPGVPSRFQSMWLLKPNYCR